jgi:hypothetical protein
MRQQENQIVLQDGEIDRRQHATIYFDSLHMDVKKTALLGEKANIDTFIIIENNGAQIAFWTVHKIVNFVCQYPPPPPPMLCLYLDCPNRKVLSVMYWRAH